MSSSPGEIITTSQMATVMRRVTGSMGRATVKGLREAAYIAKARAVKSIDEVPEFSSEARFAPVDFGEMRRSYVVDVVPDGAVLENQAAHAAIQEFGTRPFIPNRADLRAWSVRKARKAKKGRAKGFIGPQRSPEAEANAIFSTAFSSIKRRGIIPKRFHTHASQYFAGYVTEALSRRIAEVTK